MPVFYRLVSRQLLAATAVPWTLQKFNRFGDFEIAPREDGSVWEFGWAAWGTFRGRENSFIAVWRLKVIEVPPGAANSEAVRERFLREARAAGALRHPNVAAVYQFGTRQSWTVAITRWNWWKAKR